MGVTSDVSCQLLEVDYSGIEAILTGWFIRAPTYIRLARVGIHSAVAAMAIGAPADLTWSDERLGYYLADVKKQHPAVYTKSKRLVHAKNYGQTAYGAVELGLFTSIKEAQEFEQYYYALAPRLPEWHTETQQQAKKLGYLGGLTPLGQAPTKWHHPYGYRHWFWDVLSYQPTDEFTARKWLRSEQWKTRIVYLHGRPFKVKLGGDSKRVIAFYTQSTAAGRLKEAGLALFDPSSPDYIGDCYFGRTPLLGTIHDSLLLHVPVRCFDRVSNIVFRVMSRPTEHLPCPPEWNIGPHLAIGVAAKVGKDWGSMSDLDVPSLAPADNAPLLPRDDDDLESWQALARVI